MDIMAVIDVMDMMKYVLSMPAETEKTLAQKIWSM